MYDALVGANLVSDDQAAWSGKFGSLDCLVCGEKGGMYWGTANTSFTIGCRNKCDRIEIVHNLGLSGYDIARVVPKFVWTQLVH